jgi:hypothetical protein
MEENFAGNNTHNNTHNNTPEFSCCDSLQSSQQDCDQSCKQQSTACENTCEETDSFDTPSAVDESNRITGDSGIVKTNVCPTGGKPQKKIFKKPKVNEIKDYCDERNNGLDAEKFFDYYESKGWLVGKSPMKDWKACVRTWERNKFTGDKKTSSPSFRFQKHREAFVDGKRDYSETDW